MESQTVDFGIDLGTTNSAIARATRKGVVPVKNRRQSEITPSAVARTSRGQTLVGQDALDKINLEPAVRFKRLMGTANRLQMHDGTEMTPEELSAEVLKELRNAVQLRYNLVPEYVVVTVPAMFQQPQCEATHRAAELAGMRAVALIQEPIAAATAYISDFSDEEGDYLVYDLGGGTFDASVVRLRDREMNVVGHGGDNHLGGADFDREILDWLLRQLEREWDCGTELDLQREALIDLGDLGLPVAQVPITQDILADLIEKPVTRTILLTSERLEQAGIGPQAIRSMILVGGPTHTPYIRGRLKDELGIPISFEHDPMTVVARGAAMHAASILNPDRARSTSTSATSAQRASFELHYEPVSPDVQCTISGRAVEPEGMTGEVRLVSSAGDWDSGWIPLRNSAFVCAVSLRPNGTTEFQISLRDLNGRLWEVTPNTVAIRHGVVAAKPLTPYDYGVALEDGSFGLVVKRDQPLPAYGSHPFRAAKTVPAGSGEELVVYFLEGRSPVAVDNVQVSKLVICGRDLSRTLREGEEVEVRIYMDESRRIKARVFIPLLDKDYDVHLSSMIEAPPTDDMVASMDEVRASLSELEAVTDEYDAAPLLQSYRNLEEMEADIERLIAGEMGQAERVASKLSQSKEGLRNLQRKYGPAAKHRAAAESLDRAEGVAERFSDSIGLAEVSDLRSEADRCLRLGDENGLKLVEERASRLFWRHYMTTEECWIGLVQYLREQRSLAGEPVAYDEFLKRAEGCLNRSDYEGVRVHGSQALAYLPDEKSRDNRFWNAGLR